VTHPKKETLQNTYMVDFTVYSFHVMNQQEKQVATMMRLLRLFVLFLVCGM